MFKIIASLCFLGLALAADEKPATHTVDLGGLRKVQAVISVTDAEYDIRLRMLPVRVFDPATNAHLNREKARLYALAALAKHLTDKKDVELVVSGARVVEAGMEGKFYILTLRVPRGGVAIVRAGAKPPTPDRSPVAEKPERVAMTSDLLTRKSDYLKTLEQLGAALGADLKAAEKTAAKAPAEDGFSLAVAALEDRGLTNFEKLGTSIHNDLLLLFTEKDELTEQVGKQKEELINQLKAAVQRFEAHPQEKKP